MSGVEQNRYKTNNGCIKHLPQTGHIVSVREKSYVLLLKHLLNYRLNYRQLKEWTGYVVDVTTVIRPDTLCFET